MAVASPWLCPSLHHLPAELRMSIALGHEGDFLFPANKSQKTWTSNEQILSLGFNVFPNMSG